MMRNLEITAKLRTATMELAPSGLTTSTRYVCNVRVNYVISADGQELAVICKFGQENVLSNMTKKSKFYRETITFLH